jgi:hypothetical protein
VSHTAGQMLVTLLLGLGVLWFLVMLLIARVHHYAQVAEKDRWRR